MLKWTKICALYFAILGFALPAYAERYQSWQNDDTRLKQLVLQLNELIDQGERDRAADRRFLRDLRDLLAEFDNPWQRRVVNDDFRDGDYQREPAWKVVTGDFQVRRNLGLVARSAVSSRTVKKEPKEDKRSAGKDLAFAILSEILKNPEQQEAKPESEYVETREEPALIHLPASISNSFSLSMSTQVQGDSSEYAVAVYQGSPERAGYRLQIKHAAHPTVTLERYTSRGVATIDEVRVDQQTGASIDLDWKRLDDGTMRVYLNGSEIMNIRDRGFQDPFNGIAFANTQGATALRHITVDAL